MWRAQPNRLTSRIFVWIVFQSVAADEVDVHQEVLHCQVLLGVNLGHHGGEVHRLANHLQVVWHLTHGTAGVLQRGLCVSVSVSPYLLDVDWFTKYVKSFVRGEALGHIPEKEPELT